MLNKFDLWTNALPYLTAPETWVALAFGLVIGSFLNACIYRVPRGEFWSRSRSACPACGAMIPMYLNVPVLGYLLLWGKARCCGARISVQYPLVEALTGLAFVGLYWHFPFIERVGGSFAIDPAMALRFGHGTLFTCLLIVCSVIDMQLMIIPDVISLPMIALTPLVVYLHPDLTWQSALIGVVAGGGSLYAIAWLYWLVRREVGMGMGDVKLLAAIGGWLGYQAIVPTILYGSLLGAFFGFSVMIVTRTMNLRTAIPFGPFLAIGALLHFIFGHRIPEFLLLP